MPSHSSSRGTARLVLLSIADRVADEQCVGEWQVDADTRAWARQQGRLDRLGEQGLAGADGKWRARRAEFQPRTAGAWAVASPDRLLRLTGTLEYLTASSAAGVAGSSTIEDSLKASRPTGPEDTT